MQSKHTKTAVSTEPSFRLLIGVMSLFDRMARRQIVRNAYRHFDFSNLPVNIMFVDANVNTNFEIEYKVNKVLKMQKLASKWENETWGYTTFGLYREFGKGQGL